MGVVHPRPLLCERTRAWVSHALDSELSEFEQALVRSHLERCGDCSAFASGVASLTEALRAAPLESLPRPVSVPARRRRAGGGMLRIGAAAAAVVVGAFGLAGTLSLPSGSEQEAPQAQLTGSSDQQDDRLIRVPRLESMKPTPPADPGRKVVGLPF